MATKVLIPNPTFQHFSFFENGDGAVALMDEDWTWNGTFKIGELRVAFSGVCSNDIYLRVYLSSVQGAVHNLLLLSYFLNNSQYYRWEPSAQPMLFLSGDTLQVSCITLNKWALNISGWQATSVKP